MEKKDTSEIGHAEHHITAPLEVSNLGNVIMEEEEHKQTAIQAIRAQPIAFLWCLYANLCCLLVSFENQAAGVVLSIPQFRQDFGHYYEGSYVLDASWQSAFYGGPIAGTIVGTLVAGFFADKVGRKPVMLVSMFCSFAAIAMEMVATTNQLFFGAKMLNGFLTGVLFTAAMTYNGEITPLALRGFLTCFTALMFTLAPLTAAIIVNFTGDATTRWAYRAVFCAQFGFAGVCALFIAFMPESPSWLLSVGKTTAALNSFRRLGYGDDKAQLKLAQTQTMLDQIAQETAGATYLECFRGSNLRRTIISVMPICIQPLCGVFFVGSYATYYFQLAGYSTPESFKLQIGEHALSMAGNICSWYLVEHVGRRPLTFWGTSLLTVILFLVGGLATAGTKSSIQGSVVLMLIYNFVYNISIGATAYSLLVEVSASRLRIKTISIGIALQYCIYCLWAFVLPIMFNPDQGNLGAKCAFVFGGITVPLLVYVWFYQVETMGRSYEELDELFMKGISVREFKNYVSERQVKEQEAKGGLA